MGLEFHPCFFGFCLGPPGAVFFLKLPRLHDEARGELGDLAFGYWLACRGCIFDAFTEPRVEALEWFVGIEGLL